MVAGILSAIVVTGGVVFSQVRNILWVGDDHAKIQVLEADIANVKKEVSEQAHAMELFREQQSKRDTLIILNLTEIKTALQHHVGADRSRQKGASQ
jgi:hypothetical protein